MSKKIRKAVIPVAGLGTRFLPYTKAIPKEMLPIIDVPSIHIIIEEALAAGIDSVLFVTTREKHSLQDYFDKHHQLENIIEKEDKKELREQLDRIPHNFKIYSVRQIEARGLGDAIYHAKDYINPDEHFAVFLPDDLIISKVPVMKQMVKVYDEFKRTVVAVERVPKNKVSSYGIIKAKKIRERIYAAEDMQEKPPLKEAFSNLGIVGRYILPGTIFENIAKTKPGVKGEIQITDAIKMLTPGVIGYEFEGLRCDTGNKFGYIQTVLRYAAMDKNMKGDLKKEVKKLFNL